MMMVVVLVVMADLGVVVAAATAMSRKHSPAEVNRRPRCKIAGETP